MASDYNFFLFSQPFSPSERKIEREKVKTNVIFGYRDKKRGSEKEGERERGKQSERYKQKKKALQLLKEPKELEIWRMRQTERKQKR